MIICGIDPGLTGAIAWLQAPGGELIEVADMPILNLTKAKKASRIVDAYQVARALGLGTCGHVFIEVQQTRGWRERLENGKERRGGQAVQAVAKTFTNYGKLLGVIAALGIPMTDAEPRVWKAALKVPAAKDGARARASQLIPEGAKHWPMVGHHGRAEAALIALWGLSTLRAASA